MILVSGTELDASQLPNPDVMGYQIENNQTKMGIKLKTVAKSENCFQIYISEELRTVYTVTDELLSKTTYFNDDAHLIKLLESGVTGGEPDPFAEDAEVVKVEVPEFEPPAPVVFLEKTEIVEKDESDGNDLESVDEDTPSFIPAIELEMAETELPESVKMIPNIGDDVDSLRVQLKNKDAIILQKDGAIEDLKNRIEETYKLQEVQLQEVENLYKEKIDNFQEIINKLEERGAGVNLDEESTRFLKFINYARSNKAIVKEGFTEQEVDTIGSLHSKYTIFACGTGDSSYSMLKQVKKYLEVAHDCVILDFSNDNYLASIFKISTKTSNTMGLLKDDVNPYTLLKDINGNKFMPTTSYNDVVLLSIDWAKLLRKIDNMASGKDVIMIFGSINNFNVRYTVSKLATLAKLCVFVKCSPIILSSLYSDVQFIPKNRVHIVALEYIDVVSGILKELANSLMINAFGGDVEWQKLGLKK